ncbi:MAG TPA: 3-phosphoshikimate 1-carboxyvinyltransferase [Rectinema sp.]|nr:3-phosphoshikimate 1-carboxyvinyltransferase [Rectinema sp.]HOM91982.1 3-phosphoshikimate 1-carboxyvinyltransferase [Rectinema sp.]HOR49317.1 3-phosphoshikimate 1-carboxyvinyltransferase [Rectinema sp.]HOU06158.1 3-phosphoshikimate 1-carboxyvinyltransferase [Rectinema sp.]HOW11846.1 3-phosphoshikimate 1-carboxyvinyltransferase [Rectinema sp.]
MGTMVAKPGRVSGSIQAPASKSALQRAIACAILARGISHIEASPICSDARAAIFIAKELGARVQEEKGILEIEGSALFHKDTEVESTILSKKVSYPSLQDQRFQSYSPLILPCGESGLCMRMFSPIVALLDKEVELQGEGSLSSRPMNMVEESLKSLGIFCVSRGGVQPIRIRGPLRPLEGRVNALGSSQFITGLLIALPLLDGDSELIVDNLVSSGYLDLTIEMCAEFGVEIKREANGSRFLVPGYQVYKAADLAIEGDWSAGAFLAVSAAISGREDGLRIQGLRQESTQPDRAIVDVLTKAGAQVQFEGSDCIVRAANLVPFDFDATDCPDLFPPLVAMASAIHGRSCIRGTRRLLSKESDRSAALCKTFRKLGAEVTLQDDAMYIEGGSIHAATIESFGDHRIAMAASIAALVSSGEVYIEGAECVSKSWPGFFEDLSSILVS